MIVNCTRVQWVAGALPSMFGKECQPTIIIDPLGSDDVKKGFENLCK